jgi:hypothetical protein
MSQLVKLSDPSGADVYVNPDLVLYVRANRTHEGASSIFYAKDHLIEVKEGLAAVVTALTTAL